MKTTKAAAKSFGDRTAPEEQRPVFLKWVHAGTASGFLLPLCCEGLSPSPPRPTATALFWGGSWCCSWAVLGLLLSRKWRGSFLGANALHPHQALPAGSLLRNRTGLKAPSLRVFSVDVSLWAALGGSPPCPSQAAPAVALERAPCLGWHTRPWCEHSLSATRASLAQDSVAWNRDSCLPQIGVSPVRSAPFSPARGLCCIGTS